VADVDVAEVNGVHRLEDSSLTLEAWRPEILRSVGSPCTVIQAAYSLRARCGPISVGILDAIKAPLRAKGLRLGQVQMPLPKTPPEPTPPMARRRWLCLALMSGSLLL